MKRLTHAEWVAEATALFGPDPMAWRFACPCCGHVASVADYKAAGAEESAVGYSCIGRWTGAKRDALGLNSPEGLPAAGRGPCNYAGGGLFKLHPVEVVFDGSARPVFAFEAVQA